MYHKNNFWHKIRSISVCWKLNILDLTNSYTWISYPLSLPWLYELGILVFLIV